MLQSFEISNLVLKSRPSDLSTPCYKYYPIKAKRHLKSGKEGSIKYGETLLHD